MGLPTLKKGAYTALVGEFVRYTAVSAIALVVDLVVLTLLVEAGLHYLLAATVAFIIGMVVVYAASINWVFNWRRHEGRPPFEFSVFVLIGLAGLALNLLIMWVGTDVLGFYYLLSKILSVAVVFTWHFVARKLLLFTPI